MAQSRIESAYFREAVQEYVKAYLDHFGERLSSLYLWGSVYRNEAVPGISDIDIHPIIVDELEPEDELWRSQAAEELRRRFPGCEGVVRPWSKERALHLLHTGRALPIRLKYDAALLWGEDLLNGIHVIPPDREWARLSIGSLWELVLFTTGRTSERPEDFSLPEEPELRLRKLARLGVLSGANLLMAQNAFTSFQGSDVLPGLQSRYPRWAGFLDETRQLYIHPAKQAEGRLPVYLAELVNWLTWVREEIGLR